MPAHIPHDVSGMPLDVAAMLDMVEQTADAHKQTSGLVLLDPSQGNKSFPSYHRRAYGSLPPIVELAKLARGLQSRK